jgi:membrane protein YqaA with SNARE-associated domain
MPLAALAPAALYVSTFLFSLAGGILPVFNVELYLLSVAALSGGTSPLPVALAACLGQMAAKTILYFGARGLLRLPSIGLRAPTAATLGFAQGGRLSERLARGSLAAAALVLASAFTGMPPFYAVSVAAGALRVRFVCFLLAGGLGRFLRFAAVLALPGLV